jgi:hypothetical protein
MLAVATAVMQAEIPLADLASMTFWHPSMSEGLVQAAARPLMGALLCHLERCSPRGALARACPGRRGRALTGSDLLDDELADGRRAIRQAEEDARSLDTVTLLDAQRGGLYLPRELAELAASRGDPDWHARESLRFSCFAILLRPLQERARAGGPRGADYSSMVTELAQQLARIRIHAPRTT